MSNPRIDAHYAQPLTITDNGAALPAETSLGYSLDYTSRGIFHVTGGIVSSSSNTILGSRVNSTTNSSSLLRVSAMTHSRYVAVKLKPIANPYRLIVDGQFVSLTGTTLTTTSGTTPQWLLLDFGSRAIRQVTVDGGANAGVYGFWVEATGKCWPIDTASAVYGTQLCPGIGGTRGQHNIAA